MTEDFADRVDQVDFLIPPRQLGRDLAGFVFGPHHGADHLSQLDRLPLAACFRPDLEPGVRHRGDRLEPGGAIRRLERSAAVWCGCPARLLATFAETATDLEQTAAWRARPPEAKRRTGQRRQDGQQAFESAYAPARSVRQMPLPFSLNATSSTKWRITNSPRPNSRSMLSGRVGSGSRDVLNPSPSSVTWIRMKSSPSSTRTRTPLSGSSPVPYRIAF